MRSKFLNSFPHILILVGRKILCLDVKNKISNCIILCYRNGSFEYYKKKKRKRKAKLKAKISSIKFAWYILCRLFILFVCLFCFVCHGEIFLTVCPPVVYLVPSESPHRGGVHGLCFVMFQHTAGKLLNFKVFL